MEKQNINLSFVSSASRESGSWMEKHIVELNKLLENTTTPVQLPQKPRESLQQLKSITEEWENEHTMSNLGSETGKSDDDICSDDDKVDSSNLRLIERAVLVYEKETLF